MNQMQKQLLYCLSAYRQGEQSAKIVQNPGSLDFEEFYQLAFSQKLRAVAYDTLWRNPSFCTEKPELRERWKQETIRESIAQAVRSQKVIQLCGQLKKAGVPYVLVKGLLCRELYRKPDLRISGDEDLLIRRENTACCEKILKEQGFELLQNGENVDQWMDSCSGLHIELHTCMFSDRRAEYQKINAELEKEIMNPYTVAVSGGEIQSLQPTWHFLVLVLHALKHFVHGGFGIRIISDILSYAECYKKEIDREKADRILRQVHGRIFLDQIFAIGEERLGFDREESGWMYSSVPDPEHLLEDCLDAGIYGTRTESRLHSSGMVSESVEGGRKNPRIGSSLFPSAKVLSGRYPVLKKAPVLLPACWICRIGSYLRHSFVGRQKDNSPLQCLETGRKRTEMMVQYGIIQENKEEN